MNLKIVIIDYGMGNLFSVKQACIHAGLDALITSDKKELLSADAAILPGVGAFGDAMDNLHKLDMVLPIKDFVASGRQFYGICLGMQLLMDESEEFGSYKGLGLVNGCVVKFPNKDKNGRKIKVPQVGWNSIKRPLDNSSDPWNDTALENINNNELMYFVHSYYALPSEQGVVLSKTVYEGMEYCSSIKYGKNIFASQFHPEKSAGIGLNIYKNWKHIIEENKETAKHGNRN
ncbi:MAG: imidazole glycerol phosphate synthase subunit HisH [Candidatus Omnitrophica bacterium]|nr:imidazole glycerol phosphate synthase subunit HisH [Candidatus Omnitrophota bacterium]